jgi:diguanylate cyclase
MSSDPARFRGASGLERARQILQRMAELEIPPTPENYEIWATYLDGSEPDLNREIDAHLARGERFSDELNQALHERFFANTRIAVQILETSENIAGELGGVVGALEGGGAETRAYAAALLAAEQTLAGDNAALASVLAATRAAAERQERLAEQMEASARLIADMRAALSAIRLQSLTDGLTGLANRRMFDETLAKRLAEAEADRTPLALLLLDIDHFTRINSGWGAQIGDQFLRYVGAVLRSQVQGDALAARLEGDRFAIVMPRTGVDLAEAMGARVNRAIKAKQLTRKSTGDTIGSITLSAGVACHRSPEDAGALLKRTETCLTAAKHAGRDRIVTDLQFDRVRAALYPAQKAGAA